MPIFGDMDNVQAGHFGYSAVKLDSLEETAYSLATVVVDRSGSTSGFANLMAAAVRAVVEAVSDPKFNPKADNVLLRLLLVDNDVTEVHGFIPVTEIKDTGDYEDLFRPRGMTAFFDGLINAAEAAADYGQRLQQARYTVNGILIGVTDGLNNAGRYSVAGDVMHVAEAFKKVMHREAMESFDSFLIGINTKSNTEVCKYLESLRIGAGFTRPLIKVEEANKGSIAKLGLAISESISSASQALGTGGPSQSMSQNLTF